MTEREKIEKTYQQIKQKYPEITDKDEINTLAIKEDKKTTLLKAFAWLAGAIACFMIFGGFIQSENHESTRVLFLIMAGSGVVEFFRTLGVYSKIEMRYKPVVTVRNEGLLTKELVIKNGGSKLRKADYRFRIEKKCLLDKNDELDSGTDNEIYHSYTLQFITDSGISVELKVKRDVYLNAVLGVDYYLVLTTDEAGNIQDILSAYQATNWSLASELSPYYQGHVEEGDSELNQNDHGRQEPEMTVKVSQNNKSNKVMPIIAIVLAVLSIFVPLIFAIFLNIAALVLAVISLVKSRSKLSIASVAASGLCLLLTIVIIAAAMTGLV